MDDPEYRTTAVVFINGCQFWAGHEFSFREWPKADMHLEPINEGARKISAYYNLHQFEPFLPQSPVDARTGKIFLPGELPAIRSHNHPPAMRAEDAPRGTPIYLLMWDAEFGGKRFEQGEKIGYGGWPDSAMSIKPANAAAKAVMAFLKKYDPEKCPNLPVCPYNEYDGSLWLPDPPEPAPDDNQTVHVKKSAPKTRVRPATPAVGYDSLEHLIVSEIREKVFSPATVAAFERDLNRRPFSGAALGPRRN